MKFTGSRHLPTVGLFVLSLGAWSCSGDSAQRRPHPPGVAGTGGAPATGGSAGTGAPATGGAPGTGGSGGSAGSGGASGSGGGSGSGGSGGGTPTPSLDAGPQDAASPPGDGSVVGPSAPGQGPVAEGSIVLSQDFEKGMDGFSRSPRNLPADRVTLVDDPAGQRGKVVKIHYEAGDDFRTSPGTEPRSWFSSADGFTVKPGATVSVAFGFMVENPSMGAHFAQIIRPGGPLWMFGLQTDGTVTAEVHRGSGGGKSSTKLEPMKWYDFRVDTVYAGGGDIKFYMNGQLIGEGKGDGGGDARFDCGIYWFHGAKPTRTVYISNVSIGTR
jgi:hypothetical protein